MLSQRQRRILWSIVNDYILLAEPIGSRAISKKEGVGFSAATIRNEMADLEEMGFLEQPHTSSGRIPSQKGYRFYVDNLLTPILWTKEDILKLCNRYIEEIDILEEVFKYISFIVSNLTNYMTVVLGPNVFENRLRHLQIVPISSNNAICLIVTDKGQVHQQAIAIPEDLTLSSIEKLVNFFNSRLVGTKLVDVLDLIEKELIEEIRKYIDKYEKVVTLLKKILHVKEESNLYTRGTTKMLDLPEFKNTEKIKSLLDLLEDENNLFKLLKPKKKGIKISIGSENSLESLSHCSIVSAAIRKSGKVIGTIGVIGPTRMDYARVVGLLDFLVKDITSRL